jgi:hypothetical protein
MGFSQALQERVKILFVVKYILAASTSIHHMITGVFIFNSQRASHNGIPNLLAIVKSRFDPFTLHHLQGAFRAQKKGLATSRPGPGTTSRREKLARII